MGIVHRDVKSANVLVSTDGAVKLADFGLARRWDGSETRATEHEGMVGTVEYLAPEQALGKEVDARTDLYAFGVVLYEMLTGEVPFERDSAIGTVLAHLKERAPEVRAKRPDAPPWVCELVARLLEKEPARRYATAAQVLADLEARRAHSRPWWRRRTRLASAAVTGLAAGGLLLGAFAWKRAAEPRFARVAPEGRDDTRGVDSSGKILWTIRNLAPSCVTPVRAPGGRRLLAAVRGRPAKGDPAGRYFLCFLDPETGRELSRHGFGMAPGRFFGTDSMPFAPGQVSAFDLDGDGVDEVFAAYLSETSWPSALYFFDQVRQVSRLVLVAAGHHRVFGAVDVDGDGRKELLVNGIANRMGWSTALGALVVLPFVDGADSANDLLAPATTPDEARHVTLHTGFAWYALGPPFRPAAASAGVSWVDPATRLIGTNDVAGGRFVVGFDGFPPGGSVRSGGERNADRRKAYASLRDAGALLAKGEPFDAARMAATARRSAEEASDGPLAEWAERRGAAFLARAGQAKEAEGKFSRLETVSLAADEVCFEAGTALALGGAPDEAAAWFGKGLERIRSVTSGRLPGDFAEGLVLALGIAGKWSAGGDELQRLAGSPRLASEDLKGLADLVRLRIGRPPLLDWPENGLMPDVYRWVRLEARAARSEEPTTLRRALAEERARSTETAGLLLSLDGELLDRAGETNEALAASLEAWSRVRVGAADRLLDRAMAPEVAARLARLAVRAGRADLASATRQELSACLAPPKGRQK